MKKTLLFILIFSAISFSQEKIDSLFKKAILDESTAPYFILVALIDSKGKVDTVCIQAPYLRGAVRFEYKLSGSESDSRKIDSIILGNKARTFYFTDSASIKNVKPRYTKEILLEIQKQLEKFTTEELITQLKNHTVSFLHRLYNTKKPYDLYSSYRDAVAFVLLERNIPVRRGCVAGYLF